MLIGWMDRSGLDLTRSRTDQAPKCGHEMEEGIEAQMWQRWCGMEAFLCNICLCSPGNTPTATCFASVVGCPTLSVYLLFNMNLSHESPSPVRRLSSVCHHACPPSVCLTTHHFPLGLLAPCAVF